MGPEEREHVAAITACGLRAAVVLEPMTADVDQALDEAVLAGPPAALDTLPSADSMAARSRGAATMFSRPSQRITATESTMDVEISIRTPAPQRARALGGARLG